MRERVEMLLRVERAIIIGERDGVQGPAIEACVKSASAKLVLIEAQCFV